MNKENKRISNYVKREIEALQTISAILFSVASILLFLLLFAAWIVWGY